MSKRFEVHSHTHYSNIRLLDCINKPKELVNRAIELGLAGIAITDHECVSSAVLLNKYQKEIEKEHPDFKIAIGNEIYLTNTRENNQKYYHFILIAKDKIGFKQLKELSSRAWMQSYYDRGLERVPTLKSELEEIVMRDPGHLIATSACIGGELSSAVLSMETARRLGDSTQRAAAYNQIVNFISFVDRIFGDDFYIECAPGANKDQITVNKKLIEIARAYNKKMVIGTDAHYLKKEDRYVHKAYLNSKGGEREVDDFYEYSYLQDEDDIKLNLTPSIVDAYDWMCANSMEIYDKIEKYDILHNQVIPTVEVKDYPHQPIKTEFANKYPILTDMFNSDNIYERYWVNECAQELLKKNLDKPEYWARLEDEADIKRTIGAKLGTNMFSYPITLQHYVDLFWDCGSLVGAGRGSSCSGLNHYLLGITQLDPIQWNLPFWRYLNRDRVELGDIDIDICPSKKGLIIRKIKEERGQHFNEDIDELSKKNLGCVLVATFGTEGTRSTILTACRGYRSEEYPDGIDVDTAQFLSSLIPSERGFLWSLNDVVYGNPEKGREKSTLFLNEVNQYPGLLEIMQGIENLINKRSSHASGVIFNDSDPYEYLSYMRTPKGEIITAFDLHDSEACGATKYDFLVTEVQDKLVQTINFLQENNEIDPNLSLREVYNKYFHPNVIDIKDETTWKNIQEGKILNIFQFDSDVGRQAAKKIKPKNILELSDANGLMRLMASEDGSEAPMEKYIRYKNNIQLWYNEMNRSGLTAHEIEVIKPYFESSYGVPPSQEQLMMMLMDNEICHFTLKEANDARKIVGKKQMDRIPELRQKVIDQARSPRLGNYIWRYGVGPQMGYSFSTIHALRYSFIGYQTAYIATKWNPIYWNTACLIVNSGSLEEDDVEYLEDDDGDIIGAQKKESATDYAKLAKALGEIINQGIKVSLVDINKSSYGFEPDVENNQILFGMKALSNVGAPIIKQIIDNRPYLSFKDFLKKCPLNKSAMISLIKSGAFDLLEQEWAHELNIEPRMLIMGYYLSKVSDLKTRLTLQNFNGLIEADLIPAELDLQRRVFIFNKELKKNKWQTYYLLKYDAFREFYEKFFDIDQLEFFNGVAAIKQTSWDKMYKIAMDPAREWLKDKQEQILTAYNQKLIQESWEKYAQGNISAWEMEALCFYYHEHELNNIDTRRYGIVDFNSLPATPIVRSTFKRNGKQIPLYQLFRIAGTVISKNDNRHSIALLTTSGVVNVKFTKDHYALFARQISEVMPDGTKKVREKGWMTRGVKLLITGYRRDDTFVSKNYKSNGGHQLYKILDVNGKNLELTSARWGEEDDGE